jgi:hypothetical protein
MNLGIISIGKHFDVKSEGPFLTSSGTWLRKLLIRLFAWCDVNDEQLPENCRQNFDVSSDGPRRESRTFTRKVDVLTPTVPDIICMSLLNFLTKPKGLRSVFNLLQADTIISSSLLNQMKQNVQRFKTILCSLGISGCIVDTSTVDYVNISLLFHCS